MKCNSKSNIYTYKQELNMSLGSNIYSIKAGQNVRIKWSRPIEIIEIILNYILQWVYNVVEETRPPFNNTYKII